MFCEHNNPFTYVVKIIVILLYVYNYNIVKLTIVGVINDIIILSYHMYVSIYICLKIILYLLVDQTS